MTFRPTSQRRGVRWTLLLIAVMALSIIAGGTALGTLPGSTFEGSDGNLAVDTAGNKDWASGAAAVPFTAVNDLATGQNDNSFGGGSKEDDLNVTVVNGSIPNSKADLGRFAVGSETIAGDVYLYLAWTRNSQSGTTNFDFEVNQAAQPDLTTPGAKTLVRTAGDLLFQYDFLGGAQKPTLTYRTWTGTQWGAPTALGGTVSEAEVNRVTISENLLSPAISRPFAQFGEAAINLTDAGIIDPGECAPFSSIYVKSRSSTAFTSAMKDFIAPVPISFDNCAGAILITKTAKHAADEDGTIPLAGVDFDVEGTTITTDANGEACIDGLDFGDYTVTETAPAGYAGEAAKEVTVDTNATCGDDPFVGETSAWDNTPLTDVTVTIDSQVAGGTDSQVECTLDGEDAAPDDLDTDDATGDGTLSETDLLPGTYTCTITIDP